MPVEKELTALTKLKVADYDDRQDYLAATARAVGKLGEDEYDNLTEESYQWHIAAADALKAKEAIPDFDGSLPNEAGDEAEPEGEEEADAPDPEEDETDAEEPEEPKGKPTKGKAKEAPAKAAKKAKPEKAEKPAKADKPKKGPRKSDVDYEALTGETNRYGIVAGTKTDKAIAMYEKGASSKDIMDELEGRYYNILKKLQQDGHLVEKKEGKFYLTHREDLAKPKSKTK